jgi:hypothetical protein
MENLDKEYFNYNTRAQFAGFTGRHVELGRTIIMMSSIALSSCAC